MMENAGILLCATLAFYCAAAVLYLWTLGAGSDRAGPATALAAAGLAAHTGVLIARGIEQGRAPLTNLHDSISFAAWATMAIYLAARRVRRSAVFGGALSLVVLAAVVFGSTISGSTSEALVPALRSRWSTIHVVTSLLGYAGFALAFISAVGYVAQEKLLKAKRIDVFRNRLPSLDMLDRFAYSMVAVGFPMFTLGIVTGSLWAQNAWGSYWSWDPKETWSLITWLVYAAYLHVRMLLGRRGKLANRLLVAGFACVLMTFFGINLFAESLHAY
ncbi:MAG: c-type cytochrome biogenesis protein CcsB [Armatimonadota bacterium]